MKMICSAMPPVSLAPLRRARIWAMEQWVDVHCDSSYIRWAMLALALRSFSALWSGGSDRD